MSTSTSTGSRNQTAFALRAQWVSAGSAAYTDLVIDRARNATLWDVDGREYIDFAGGIGTLNVGHCHPRVVEAVQEQAGRLMHTSLHVAAYESYFEVCRELCERVPGSARKKAILFNSGSEAIENAVKLARAFTRRRGVASFDHAFHGRTLLCLALDHRLKPLRQGFGPAPADVYRARFPYPYRPPRGVAPEELTDWCLEELERFFRREVAPEELAAFVVEPLQGEGGFIVPTPGFLRGLRRVCDQHGILLIVDEVQSGFGRTGRFWGMEHEGVVPDLVAVGKSLAAGMPLSGVVGRADVLDAAPAGAIGGTYGGNPLACAAALAVFRIMEEERLVEAGVRIGEIVRERFDALRDRVGIVGDSRGLGAMRGLELVTDKASRRPLPAGEGKRILEECLRRGLLVIKAGLDDNVIRTLMPLTIPDEQLQRGLDIIEAVLTSHRT
jgi:4-aminobutyrate aminotransferase/(S)-3-amino-2-methylpropionate transaminase